MYAPAASSEVSLQGSAVRSGRTLDRAGIKCHNVCDTMCPYDHTYDQATYDHTADQAPLPQSCMPPQARRCLTACVQHHHEQHSGQWHLLQATSHVAMNLSLCLQLPSGPQSLYGDMLQQQMFSLCRHAVQALNLQLCHLALTKHMTASFSQVDPPQWSLVVYVCAFRPPGRCSCTAADDMLLTLITLQCRICIAE